MFQDLWKTICKVRSTYFPFDQQHCTIIIRSGARDSQSIKFIHRRPIQGHSFIRGEWELVHSYTDITDERISDFGQVDFSLVRFTLILKRNHLYYLIKIILPFALVSFVTLFTFLLPPQTGEKLTLNVTILLSLVIYLQLLSEYVPKSDDETPILTLFCNANFFLVFISCIMTVYVLYLYHRPSTAHIACVPPYLKLIFIDYLSPFVYCRLNRNRSRTPKIPRKNSPEKRPRRLSSIEKRMCHLFSFSTPTKTTNQQVKSDFETIPCIRASLFAILSFKAIELLQCLQQFKAHIRKEWLAPVNGASEYEIGSDFLKIDNQQKLDEWQHIALVVDRLFFILFIIAMPCTALLFVSAHSSIANDFRSNISTFKLPSVDAKCDSLYKPMLN